MAAVAIMVVVAGVALIKSGIVSLPTEEKNLKDELAKIDIKSEPVSKQAAEKENNKSDEKKSMKLEIRTTEAGTGDKVVANGDTVAVKYTGKLTDGTVFDATDKHGGQPFSFTVGAGEVIKGWDQGLLGAKVGEKRTLTIPAELGYGSRGAGGVIPPNATLIFDIEVVSIK
jgi:peptidylprolyl isomerase